MKKTFSIPEDLDARVRGWAEEHSVSYSEAICTLAARAIDHDVDEPIAPRVYSIVQHAGDTTVWRVEDIMREFYELVAAHIDAKTDETVASVLAALGEDDDDLETE